MKKNILFRVDYNETIGYGHLITEEENKYCYALFDCGVEDNHYFSEDWLFCHRWSKMGGKLWIDISINLTHTGVEDYKGSLLSSLL